MALTQRTKDYVLLAALTVILLVIVWRFYPILMTVETGRALAH